MLERIKALSHEGLRGCWGWHRMSESQYSWGFVGRMAWPGQVDGSWEAGGGRHLSVGAFGRQD